MGMVNPFFTIFVFLTLYLPIAFNQNTIDGKDYSPSLHLILCELDVSITLIKSRYVGIHFRNGIGNVFNADHFTNHNFQFSVANCFQFTFSSFSGYIQ